MRLSRKTQDVSSELNGNEKFTKYSVKRNVLIISNHTKHQVFHYFLGLFYVGKNNSPQGPEGSVNTSFISLKNIDNTDRRTLGKQTIQQVKNLADITQLSELKFKAIWPSESKE